MTLIETLKIPDITKSNLITVLLYIVLKKITTNKPSHRTQFNIALKNHALHAQPISQFSAGK